MVIESVQRLAHFEHDVVCYINDVADAADTGLFQSALQPGGAWSDVDTANDARNVARAKLGIFDANIDQLGRSAFCVREFDLGKFQRISSSRADFASNADHT